MEITIKDFREKFGFNNTTALLSVLYEKHPNAKELWDVFIQMFSDGIVRLPEIEELLPLMSKVNKEVKHPSCPNNLRNRFYSKKEKIIKCLLNNGEIDSIIESDNLYKFVIGEYSFHQLKNNWSGKVKKVDGIEVYEETEVSLPFSREDYDNFGLVAVLYLATKGGKQMKN